MRRSERKAFPHRSRIPGQRPQCRHRTAQQSRIFFEMTRLDFRSADLVPPSGFKG